MAAVIRPEPSELPRPRRWLAALKLEGWPKLLAPMVMGQGLAVAATGHLGLGAAALAILHSGALAAAIVLLNDYADQRVDALKRSLYPVECSPKTIPDRLLGAQAVLLAGLGAAVLSLAVGALAEVGLGQTGATAGALVCFACFAAYSLPPLRLNYRGGGEFLEMVGVGVLLPGYGAFLQGGVGGLALAALVLPGLALLALASALASGLADEVSDRRGGKTTFVTRFGNAFTRSAAEGLLSAGAILWALAGRAIDPALGVWVALPPLVVLVVHLRDVHARSAAARTHQLAAIRAYKKVLNRGVALATVVFALALVLVGLLRGGVG